MTELSIYKVNPTGNITLIIDTPVKRECQAAIAAFLMEQDKSAEQVGFLEKPASECAQMRLQMMGGEFCGNASIGTAAVMAEKLGAEELDVLLEVSGSAEEVPISVMRNADGSFTGTVSMPIPESIYDFTFLNGLDTYTFPLVRFPGICHVIIDRRFSPELAQSLITDWCDQLKTEALGLMFVSDDLQRMEPLVYVASTNTTVWETSCASGTCAVAAFTAQRRRHRVKLSLVQPGGTLTAEAEYAQNAVRSIKLTGKVVIEGQYTST